MSPQTLRRELAALERSLAADERLLHDATALHPGLGAETVVADLRERVTEGYLIRDRMRAILDRLGRA